MKRILVVLLVLMIALCGCGKSNNEILNDTNDTNDMGDKNADYVSMQGLYMITYYSEGLAFAEYNDEQVCIDKEGKIIFRLSDEYDIDRTMEGFNNGIAVIEGFDQNNEHQRYFCRKDGTIIKPEDVGATKFAIAPSNDVHIIADMFKDGYILAYNIRYDDTGAVSVMEAGILSPEMEWIIPLSNSFYNTIAIYSELQVEYHCGYILVLENQYLNLKTGEESVDFGALYSADDIEYASDFWEGYPGNPCKVYDDRDGKIFNRKSALDLSQYGEINTSFQFTKGIAPVILGREPECKFSLLREDGTLCFEPVLINASEHQSYDETTGLYLISHKNDLGNLVLELFNTDGKVKNYTLDSSKYPNASAIVSDGVIVIYTYDADDSIEMKSELLTTDFTPLF